MARAKRFLDDCRRLRRWRHNSSQRLPWCCDQPLFILALFLHPRHRSTFKKIADETPLTSLGQLCKFAIFYYTRFIDENIG
jgi:hypothetical protein